MKKSLVSILRGSVYGYVFATILAFVLGLHITIMALIGIAMIVTVMIIRIRNRK